LLIILQDKTTACTQDALSQRRLQRVKDCDGRHRLLCDEQAHCISNYTGCRCPAVSKLCMLMHDVYHSKASGYLADLCVRCSDTRLRSSSRGDFIVQRTRLRPTEKSFSVAGPRAWNSLPSIRTLVSRDSFSRHLKTHFLKLSCDIQ